MFRVPLLERETAFQSVLSSTRSSSAVSIQQSALLEVVEKSPVALSRFDFKQWHTNDCFRSLPMERSDTDRRTAAASPARHASLSHAPTRDSLVPDSFALATV